ncbi:MAG: hypothetical protein ACE14V_12815 [bacterium]
MNLWETIKTKKLTPYLISLGFFCLCWFFRSAIFDGGSSDLWVREIESGVWFRKRRLLSFFMMQLTYKISNYLGHWDGRLTINLVSCLSGIIFVFFLYRICQRWEKGWVPFLLVMTTGMTGLFFGFIETYAQVVAAATVFFYFLFEYLEGRVDARYPAFFYTIAAMCHLEVGFFFPVIPIAWYFRGHKVKDIYYWLFGLLPLALFWLAISRFGIGEGDLFENIQWVTFTPRPDHTEPYWLFSWSHLKEFAQFQYRIAVITIPALIVLLFSIKKRDWLNPVILILFVATLGLFILDFGHYPQRNLYIWGVFAIFGLPSTLLVGYLLSRYRYADRIAVCLIIVSMIVSASMIIPRARLGYRGEGTILIQNVPIGTTIILDGFLKPKAIYHILQGEHNLKVISPPNKFEQNIFVKPKETVVIQYQPQPKIVKR